MTIWRMHIACCIPRDTNTHSEYVTLIAFPLQHSFYESASMLLCTYIDSLFSFLDYQNCFKVILPVGYRKLIDNVEIITQLKDLVIFNVAAYFDLVRSSSG